ncbi:MAG: hypothetical protein PHF46_01990 [Candidatus Gracilibacteria bacterium]|nr:hypothetical protein [Candidatus Gracilibacteria bacterium]MDD3120155.1 hypothetical protein [Candidatus Gracilibacteria bacterium]
MKNNNKVMIFFDLVISFFKSIFGSVSLFFSVLIGKNREVLKENKFMDTFNFLFNIGPRGFWKKPSGIKIGRSLSTFIYYIFYKDEYFKEVKKK